MQVEYCFPTPIYYNVIDNKAIHDEIDNYIGLIKESDLSSPWMDNVITTFKSHKKILDYTPTLKTAIIKECLNYLNAVNMQKKVTVPESWLNITNHNQFQHYHIHDDHHISGVFYHQTSGEDGDIVFHHPSLANRISMITKNISNPVSYTPQKGKILLFPGFLEHAVELNKTHQQRISVSFNIKLY